MSSLLVSAHPRFLFHSVSLPLLHFPPLSLALLFTIPLLPTPNLPKTVSTISTLSLSSLLRASPQKSSASPKWTFPKQIALGERAGNQVRNNRKWFFESNGRACRITRVKIIYVTDQVVSRRVPVDGDTLCVGTPRIWIFRSEIFHWFMEHLLQPAPSNSLDMSI